MRDETRAGLDGPGIEDVRFTSQAIKVTLKRLYPCDGYII
jgi:hypothetical protein